MKVVRFIADFGDHKAGQTVSIDDQLALNAFVAGAATPTTDAPDAPAVVIAEKPVEHASTEAAGAENAAEKPSEAHGAATETAPADAQIAAEDVK